MLLRAGRCSTTALCLGSARRMQRYDFLRKHLVKVRDFLASAMMMDGWGDTVLVD